MSATSLTGYRIVAAMNGLELFGHERGNIEVFKALRSLDAQVVVGINARDEGGDVGRELDRLGFETFALPFNPQWSAAFLRKHPMMLFTNPLATVRCSMRFHRRARAFRATHVHLGSSLVYSYLFEALALSDLPLVFRIGDCPPVESPFNLAIWKAAARRATRIAAVSKFVAESAARVGVNAAKIATVYSVAPSRATGDLHRTAGEFERDRIVYVGALAEHKGIIPLIDAVGVLAAERPGLALDIVGGSAWDSDFRARVTGLIAANGLTSRVTLHGYVDQPDSFYRRAAIHVAPAIWEEPLANVVIEAKRAGVPSVVFPSGGLPEVINHEVDGHICSDRTAESLVASLRWMLADDSRLLAMRAAAAADYEARFGEGRFALAWADVYHSTACA